MTRKPTFPALSLSELSSLLDRSVFAISRLREIELGQFGITIPQSSILRLLQSQNGSFTIQDLKKNRMRQPHSISALINRMAKIGLVKKSKDSHGKKYQINITAEGKKINQKLTETSIQICFGALSTKEKIELANCLLPLLEKARYLLGMSQTTRFIRSLNQPKNKKSSETQNDKIASVTDYDLWVLFDQVGFAISRLREIELTQFEMTLQQSAILYALTTHEDSMTMAEIEDYTMRKPISILLLINRMEKLGLISQIKNRKDKKKSLVITKQGKNIFGQLTEASNDLIFSTLSSAQQKQLTDFLGMLLERARYLLGINYVPPIYNYLKNPESIKNLPKIIP